jgi:nitroreductase
MRWQRSGRLSAIWKHARVSEQLDLSLDELLTTTRAVRKRLDLSRPVGRDVVEECLSIAVQAPTGSNAQAWQWLFVEDAATKRALADVYRSVFESYMSAAPASAGFAADDPRGKRRDAVSESAKYLADHFHEVPVLMLPYYEGRAEDRSPSQAGYYGSIVPAVWSFMLALRARGMGSAWTTMTCRREAEVGEIVGVDHTKYTHIGMFPIAYTIGTDFKPASRVGLDQITHWNRWNAK